MLIQWGLANRKVKFLLSRPLSGKSVRITRSRYLEFFRITLICPDNETPKTTDTKRPHCSFSLKYVRTYEWTTFFVDRNCVVRRAGNECRKNDRHLQSKGMHICMKIQFFLSFKFVSLYFLVILSYIETLKVTKSTRDLQIG